MNNFSCVSPDSYLHPGLFAQTASAWVPAPAPQATPRSPALGESTLSQPLPILIVAAGVVVLILVLLVVSLLVNRWRHRQARQTRSPLPREAPELYDLRTAELVEDIRFCVDLARQSCGPVLELGAGTGRITLELARRGLMVTGLEPSRQRVLWAKTRFERLSAKRRVEWVEGELTTFSLGGRKFKLILAPFNALEEVRDLTDLERCLPLWRTIWSQTAYLSPWCSRHAGKRLRSSAAM